MHILGTIWRYTHVPIYVLLIDWLICLLSISTLCRSVPISGYLCFSHFWILLESNEKRKEHFNSNRFLYINYFSGKLYEWNKTTIFLKLKIQESLDSSIFPFPDINEPLSLVQITFVMWPQAFLLLQPPGTIVAQGPCLLSRVIQTASCQGSLPTISLFNLTFPVVFSIKHRCLWDTWWKKFHDKWNYESSPVLSSWRFIEHIRVLDVVACSIAKSSKQEKNQ